MGKKKRPCLDAVVDPIAVAREAAQELLSWQEKRAECAPCTPAVDVCKLFCMSPTDKILAFLEGMHHRLGKSTLYFNLNANVAEMICKMYVKLWNVQMLHG
jgi:hypothetical protein